jgi:hypothetical protein
MQQLERNEGKYTGGHWAMRQTGQLEGQVKWTGGL